MLLTSHPSCWALLQGRCSRSVELSCSEIWVPHAYKPHCLLSINSDIVVYGGSVLLNAYKKQYK